MTMDPVVIVSAARTPMGAFMGELKSLAAPELGAIAFERFAGSRRRVMAKPIDFYFDFSSPYGYFARTKIDDLAAKIVPARPKNPPTAMRVPASRSRSIDWTPQDARRCIR